ncbi:hypothetical protein HJG60_008329 [Phyllostomus discolor]|uniref:Uncharacterized protein n=1 Tax=Phyllostomus discolor TaxID=89673 RepID=A0A834DPE9_9CHIR|nr:hypothetical protein HJG60_008329 [Phyllostomus discolor]
MGTESLGSTRYTPPRSHEGAAGMFQGEMDTNMQSCLRTLSAPLLHVSVLRHSVGDTAPDTGLCPSHQPCVPQPWPSLHGRHPEGLKTAKPLLWAFSHFLPWLICLPIYTVVQTNTHALSQRGSKVPGSCRAGGGGGGGMAAQMAWTVQPHSLALLSSPLCDKKSRCTFQVSLAL